MIELKQITDGRVRALDDALLYNILYPGSGIISGCTVALVANNQLNVADGRGVACGRFFTISGDESILATLSPSGSIPGRLIVRVDISNAQTPIQIIAQAGSPLPDLVQEDLNAGGSVYEIPLAVYTVTETNITGLTNSQQMAVFYQPPGPIQTFPLPISSGATQVQDTPIYGKSSQGICWVNFAVDVHSITSDYVNIARLPEGFYNKDHATIFTCMQSGEDDRHGTVRYGYIAASNGYLIIRTTDHDNTYFRGSVVYFV